MLKQAHFQLSVLFLLAHGSLMGTRLFNGVVALRVYLQGSRGTRGVSVIQAHPKLRAGT